MSTSVTRHELLFAGYFRNIEKMLRTNIPREIVRIIVMYQKMSLIFGIGCPGHIFGLNKEDLTQYSPLTTFQEILPHIDNVYRNNRSLMVIGQNNEVYATGRNVRYRLGIKGDSEWSNLSQFTKIKDNIKLVSTGCENDSHCFIYSLDDKLYALGSNIGGSFGNGESGGYDVLCEVGTKFIKNKHEHIIKIELGPCVSFFLTNYGSLYYCGSAMHSDMDDQYLGM